MLVNMSETDLELLARYVRHNAEDAFAEIVRRHLGLVYTAAQRQVRSPQLAEEVAQSVFLKLARHAGELAADTIVSAWLYQVTRREAIDVVRREARRQLREQVASEMNAMNATTDDWTQIEPVLDEAMQALEETDRAAVLLRYFENKSLHDVGQTLGTSDDAAQKRVSRAVERLRDFFTKRGVTVGASGLVLLISAHAIQAAPVGLAATISNNVVLGGTIVAAAATTTGAKVIVMTTLQKTLIATAVIAVGLGTAMFVHHHHHWFARQRPAAGLSNKAAPTEFPQQSWKFAGYADPESGYQSLMWAMSQGNLDITLGSLTPDERAKWERNMKKPRTEVAAQMASRTKQTELFRILDKQSVSDTETHLCIQSIGPTNEDPVKEQWARMLKIGSDWKFEGWVGN
jgi:RNA polymerase sigma factor (sigma-70 family)